MIPTNYAEVDALYRQVVADGASRLVVTSPGSDDGATTLAYALARRASRSGRSVLMIDLNIHRPSLDALVGLDQVDWSPADPASVDAAITQFGADGMAALPAPAMETVSTAFREPAVLARCLDRLGEVYDFIVIDAAPVGARNARNVPPLAVCRAAGAVLLSVMARQTSEADGVAAVAAIRGEGARLVGAVINDRDNPSLGEELEREAARLRPLSPALTGWLQRLIQRATLIYQLP
jgi:Mrp family chromosome partitioning ATPase